MERTSKVNWTLRAPSKRQATAETVVAALLWGFGFIAARWCFESMGPYSSTWLRFGLATLFSTPVLFRYSAKNIIQSLKLTFFPGILLGLTLTLQTVGLKYTTVANSGFFTTLYVLFVCLLEGLLPGRSFKVINVVFVAIALVGAALMSGGFDLSHFNKGDLLTILCAICASFQILYIGYINNQIQSAALFNTTQSFWAMLPALIMAVMSESFPTSFSVRAFVGLMSLVLGSTILGFFIQVRVQKIIPATTASMIFLLESPFAAVFGYWFFGEVMTEIQILGAVLISAAALAALQIEMKKELTK